MTVGRRALGFDVTADRVIDASGNVSWRLPNLDQSPSTPRKSGDVKSRGFYFVGTTDVDLKPLDNTDVHEDWEHSPVWSGKRDVLSLEGLLLSVGDENNRRSPRLRPLPQSTNSGAFQAHIWTFARVTHCHQPFSLPELIILILP